MTNLAGIDIVKMNETYRNYMADPMTKKDAGGAFMEGYAEGNKGYQAVFEELRVARESLHLNKKMVQTQDARIEVLQMAEKMAEEDARERIRRRDALVAKMFNYAADNPESVDLTLTNLILEYADVVHTEDREEAEGDDYAS